MFIKLLRIIFLSLNRLKRQISYSWSRFYFYVITEKSDMKIDIHPSVEIKNSYKVSLQKRSIVKKGSILNGRSGSKIGVLLGEDTCIKEYCYIDSYGGSIKFEGNSSIGQFCIIAGQGDISIGKYVMMGAHTYILSSNHVFSSLDIPYIFQGNKVDSVIIEKNVWVGGNVIILPGVKIGKNSVIGAGSVVQNDIPPNTIYYTNRKSGKNEMIKHSKNYGADFS